MKKNSTVIILFGIIIFLFCNTIKASGNTTNKITEANLGVENLIEYINNIDLTDEKANNISEKSKLISQDIKENAKFTDYKLTEIIRIYRSFTSISNDLNLNIDFSIKNGDFTLKDRANNNSVFKGNIGEIKKYFEALKNNTELLV